MVMEGEVRLHLQREGKLASGIWQVLGKRPANRGNLGTYVGGVQTGELLSAGLQLILLPATVPTSATDEVHIRWE